MAQAGRQRGQGKGDDGRVQGAVFDLADQAVAGAAQQADPDARIPLVEGAEQRRQAGVLHSVDRADGQVAGEQSGAGRELGAGRRGGGEGGARVRQQRLGRRGRPHTARGPVEQGLAQLALQERICWLMAGWAMRNRAAARVKDRSSATATKYSSVRSSITAS